MQDRLKKLAKSYSILVQDWLRYEVSFNRLGYLRIRNRHEKLGLGPRSNCYVCLWPYTSRLKAVEEAIRNAEKNELNRTDPAKSARAQSTMELIEAKLIKTEKERESALSSGDTKKAEKLALTIESQKMLLEATKTALADFTR